MRDPIDLLAAQLAVHARYSEHHFDLQGDVRTALELIGHEAVLDIGCGTGTFLHGLRANGHHGPLIGADLRASALTAVAALGSVYGCRADATQLPFTGDSVDRVSAMHLLYYLSDPAAGVREIRRIIRSGGRIAFTLNHTTTAPRLRGLVVAHAERYGFAARPAAMTWAADPAGTAQLTIEGAAELISAEFGNVSIWRRDNALALPSPEDVVDYADVFAQFTCGVPGDSAHRTEILAAVRVDVERWFDRHGGPWRDPKGYTVLSSDT
ncbi:class I SAM-dependent methyltransferase [Nocardia sp. NPDC057227]|uniref:class I SAM-dependent methyltransferase n=1 Tax=Nocardia sp. NPDC057227 TaxID=3346056 RepID=UPI00363E3F01